MTRNERTYILPPEPALVERVPQGDGVILEVQIEKASLRKQFMRLLPRRSIGVQGIRIHCKDLEDFLAAEERSFGHEMDVSFNTCLDIAEILAHSAELENDMYRFVLPLQDAHDSLVIKLLGSLGIGILLDLRDPLFNWREAGELIADNILNLAPRGLLEPIASLLHGLEKKDYFLGEIYHEDPRRYAWVDEQGRMALGEKDRGAGNWISARLGDGIREEDLGDQTIFHPHDLLRRRHRCAFCEGFFLCRGYLDAYGQEPFCQGFFNALFDAVCIRGTKNGKTGHETHAHR